MMFLLIVGYDVLIDLISVSASGNSISRIRYFSCIFRFLESLDDKIMFKRENIIMTP
jgi:hypothetical protein